MDDRSQITIRSLAATLAAFFLLAMVSVFVKLQEDGGAPIEWIVFVQYATCLFIILAIASKNKFRDLRTKVFKLHFVRAVTGILAFTCSVIAITKIDLVNASLLNNTTPLFIPLIVLIYLKQKFDEKIWWGIAVGFIGIILILRPNPQELLKVGDVYGLAAGIFLAIAYVALKALTKTESFITVLFYYSFISFVIALPFAVMNWVNPPPLIWLYGTLTGMCFISYLYMIQYAYQITEAVKLAPFNYSVVVFTGLLAWIIFDEIPSPMSAIGIILVIIGGILSITLHEKGNKDLKHSIHG